MSTPTIVDAATGRGRAFVASSQQGYEGADLVPGSTLLTRNMSVQAILRWDLTDQAAVNTLGALYIRGKAGSVAEYYSAGVELRVVNVALGVGEVRWLWMDIAGVLKRQVGAHFIPPTDGSFIMLTATRRWVSSTKVVLRYFLADRMIGEVESGDGSIGGGTTGTTTIGARFDGALWTDFFDGVLDELRVVDYELAPEEIEMTWKRLTKYQPRGYELLKQMHPPGFPISGDPSSRVQRETNMWGQGLGYAAAQAENVRANILPDRAFGEPLAQWEGILKQPPKALDDIDTRRARVVGRLRQRAGVSIPGVKEAIKGLIATQPDNLEIISLSQVVTEVYNNVERWSYDTFRPAASGNWGPGVGLLQLVTAAASATYDSKLWCTADLSISSASFYRQTGNVIASEGYGAHLLTKLDPQVLPSRAEAGVAFHDAGRSNTLFLGLRNNAGVYQIITERFVGGISQGVTVRAVSALQAHWLHLWSDAPPVPALVPPIPGGLWPMKAAWSTTSAIAGFTTYTLNHDARYQWASLYARTFDIGGSTVPASGIDVDFDETSLFTPYGDRTQYFYVYRNPALAGAADVLGARAVIKGLKHAQTHASLITNKSTLYDDATTPFDEGPTGGY